MFAVEEMKNIFKLKLHNGCDIITKNIIKYEYRNVGNSDHRYGDIQFMSENFMYRNIQVG